MTVSQKTLEALAKGRAVKAERRAALKAANAQKIAIIKNLGISHLGEVYVPSNDISTALVKHLVDGKAIND